MDVLCEFEWNRKTKKGLEVLPDNILYSIAKQTLDISYPSIPMSNLVNHAGTLRRASMSGGVKGGNGDYYIGSYTKYASIVWNRDDTTTNWTTPGTHSQWYARTLQKKGQIILDNAINQTWKENM